MNCVCVAFSVQMVMLLLICVFVCTTSALRGTESAFRVVVRPKISGTKINSMWLADGLDADTLGALGDMQEMGEALDQAIDSSNPAMSVLTKIVASPAIIAVPIGSGLLVAAALGLFISSYANGKE